MNFKLVYEKDAMIKGSVEGIPTAADADIISREALDECKIVYFVDGELRGSTTSNIPSADDTVLYSTKATETPAPTPTPEEEPVEKEEE
jgi:hypothetical protein